MLLPTHGTGGLQAGVDLDDKEALAELIGDNAAPDVSVCIFAIREDSCPNHATYRTWLTRLLTGDGEQTQNRPTRPQNGRFCVCSRH